MKIFFTAIMTTFFSSSVFAFNSVTEILPGGKILICSKRNEVKKGDVVEVYTRANPRSRSDFSITKSSEFKLPSVGQKIILTHIGFHSKGRITSFQSEVIGTAIVSGESLEGEERIVYSLDNSRYSKRIQNLTKLSRNDALKIQNECLVAIPMNDFILNERASVYWE